MQAEDQGAIPRAFVHVMHPEATAHAVVDLEIVGFEGESRKILESLVRCSKGSHDCCLIWGRYQMGEDQARS